MPLLLKKYVNTVLIIITIPLNLFLLYLLFQPPLTVFTVSLCEFDFCRLIGKHRFFAASEVDQMQHNQDLFRFRHTVFYSQIKYAHKFMKRVHIPPIVPQFFVRAEVLWAAFDAPAFKFVVWFVFYCVSLEKNMKRE